jgi:hypothetical protein
MSADIGPGDFVECVDDAPGPGNHKGIAAGNIYTIRKVQESLVTPGTFGVLLVGIILPRHPLGHEIAWKTDRFRPIYRPKPDAFTDLLKVPDRQRVTA